MTGGADGLGGRASRNMRIVAWSLAGLLLLLPAIAMLVTDEVRWGPLDFAVFATMLAAAGGAIEVAVRRTPRRGPRVAVIAAVAVIFLAVWASQI